MELYLNNLITFVIKLKRNSQQCVVVQVVKLFVLVAMIEFESIGKKTCLKKIEPVPPQI